MIDYSANPRTREGDADAIFIDRWSPRSFKKDPLTDAQLDALFEACRWAPSCFNEQPWHFLYAMKDEDRKVFSGLLVEKNRLWASKAPLLLFVLARKNFSRNDKPNRHAIFDAGAAWMSLALQARRMGLYAHGMAGFEVEKSYEVLNVDKERYELIAAVAVGRIDDPSLLPEELSTMEKPNQRNPLLDIRDEGIMP